MEAQCPECGHDFSVPFDPQEFFFGELRTSRDFLYREVHYLAYHYHWSEQEIMAMPRDKRRRRLPARLRNHPGTAGCCCTPRPSTLAQSPGAQPDAADRYHPAVETRIST